jgi:hypothetical protein
LGYPNYQPPPDSLEQLLRQLQQTVEQIREQLQAEPDVANFVNVTLSSFVRSNLNLSSQ